MPATSTVLPLPWPLTPFPHAARLSPRISTLFKWPLEESRVLQRTSRLRNAHRPPPFETPNLSSCIGASEAGDCRRLRTSPHPSQSSRAGSCTAPQQEATHWERRQCRGHQCERTMYTRGSPTSGSSNSRHGIPGQLGGTTTPESVSA